MALILAMETSGDLCSVALHEHGSLIATKTVHEPQSHARKLAVLIDELFREQKLDRTSLRAVAVSSGPGSYTGLRIGISTAKGICFALNIPLIGVQTLDLIIYQFRKSNKNAGLYCAMIDAKRMEVYCKIVDERLTEIISAEARVVDESSFAELLDSHPVFFFGPGAGKCKSVIRRNNAFFVEGIFPDANALGEVAFSYYQKEQFESLSEFTPFYMKEFIAKQAGRS